MDLVLVEKHPKDCIAGLMGADFDCFDEGHSQNFPKRWLTDKIMIFLTNEATDIYILWM